jgi:hypothetical protein
MVITAAGGTPLIGAGSPLIGSAHRGPEPSILRAGRETWGPPTPGSAGESLPWSTRGDGIGCYQWGSFVPSRGSQGSLVSIGGDTARGSLATKQRRTVARQSVDHIRVHTPWGNYPDFHGTMGHTPWGNYPDFHGMMGHTPWGNYPDFHGTMGQDNTCCKALCPSLSTITRRPV